MKKIYLLSGKHLPKVASAFAPESAPLAHELIDMVDGKSELPFEMELVKLSDGKNGLVKSNDLSDLKTVWLDHQPNSLAWPMMSENMKILIEKHLTGKEEISWIAAKINNDKHFRHYYFPRFEKLLDVLDIEKTKLINDRIIKPYFSFSKTANYNMFHQPSKHNLWKITPRLYVDEGIKAALQSAEISGIEFDEVPAG